MTCYTKKNSRSDTYYITVVAPSRTPTPETSDGSQKTGISQCSFNNVSFSSSPHLYWFEQHCYCLQGLKMNLLRGTLFPLLRYGFSLRCRESQQSPGGIVARIQKHNP